MENASKALLIAGSVLIAILLVAMGVKTINSTSDMTEHVDTVSKSTAASSFNSQFLPYLSDSTSGVKAKSLVSKVLSHNATVSSDINDFSAASHQIHINLYADKDQTTHNSSDKDGDGVGDGHNWKPHELQDVYNRILDTANYKIKVNTNCSKYKGGYYNGYIICISIVPTT